MFPSLCQHRSIEQLVAAKNPGRLRRLRGDQWTFAGVVRQVESYRGLLAELPVARLRGIAHALSHAFALDWRLVATNQGTRIVSQAARTEPTRAPTIFLPYFILAEGLMPRLYEFEHDDLVFAYAYGRLAVASMLAYPDFIPQASNIARSTGRLLRLTHHAEVATPFLEIAVNSLLELAPRFPRIVADRLVGMVEELYDAKFAVADGDPPIAAAERLRVTQTMRDLVDELLEPAIRIRLALWGANLSPEQTRENRRAQAALTHHRLTLDASAAIMRGAWSPNSTMTWLNLAREYRAIGDHVDATIVQSVLIDDLLEIIAVYPRKVRPLARSLRVAASNLDAGLPQLRDTPELFRDLAKRSARAFAALGDGLRARGAVTVALDSLRDELAVAKTEFQRSALLRDADDWFGIDWEISWPPGQGFATTYSRIRGHALAGPPPTSPGANAATVFVTRRGSAIAWAPNPNPPAITWLRGQDAHTLALTLTRFQRRTERDVAAFLQTHVLPPTGPEWNRLVAMLQGQSGLQGLANTAAAAATGRWAIECDGNSILLPVGALAWNALRASAVAIALPVGATTAVAAVAGDARVAINAFPPTEAIHVNFDALAAQAGMPVRDIHSVADLRAAFAQPCRLILFGCHGLNTSPIGEAVLQLPAGPVPMREAFDAVTLPKQATVFAITCFGGSGLHTATGKWESLPQYLVDAGARGVVANRWHAWFEPGTWTQMHALLTALDAASTAADAWPTATAVSTFLAALHPNTDARQWSGWSFFARRDAL